MKNIILIAPPAAGKGTQSKLLEQKYGYKHISAGDLLRESAKTNQFIASELKLGHFIDDEIIIELLEKELSNNHNKYILDGFPRNMYQVKKYEEIINKLNLDFGHIIIIDLNYTDALNRVLGRLICTSCGAIYNETEITMIPIVKNKCNKCDSILYKRTDDNQDTFKKRYDTYKEQTEPIIKYFEQKYKVVHIDSISIESTFKKISEIIKVGE